MAGELQFRTSDGALLYVGEGANAGRLACECCCDPCLCDSPLDVIHLSMTVACPALNLTCTVAGDLERISGSACGWEAWLDCAGLCPTYGNPPIVEPCIAVAVTLQPPCRWAVSTGGIMDICYIFKEFDHNDPTGAYTLDPSQPPPPYPQGVWTISDVVVS